MILLIDEPLVSYDEDLTQRLETMRAVARLLERPIPVKNWLQSVSLAPLPATLRKEA